ncbi:CAP domain-containing protein [Lysinibacillus sp. 54212]|uniref:CAP domain-containing protein n=1 Tax=Lysinibacillus sp. 54212 TaxID=3119829 RepID=UPI002FC6A6A7
MKALFRILIVATLLGMIYYYSFIEQPEHEPLEGPNTVQQAIPSEHYENDFNETLSRPTEGVSVFIGKSSELLIKNYGEPLRIDQSGYGYNWWVYNEGTFMMFGVEDDIVTQVYTNDRLVEVSPYEIGQKAEDVYRMTILEGEVTVEMDDNLYMFTMNQEDTKTRLLAKFDGLYAQLYIDSELGKLVGVRYMDGKTLVMQQPYEMQYVGELIEQPVLSSYSQLALHEATAQQLFDLANRFRQQHSLKPLLRLQSLDEAAMAHSEDMFLQNYVSHESPTLGTLTDRLNEKEITYEESGENIATSYYDAIEAVHGWINSSDHRTVLLDEKFTSVGSGVYYDYYTQIFIKQEQIDPFEDSSLQ